MTFSRALMSAALLGLAGFLLFAACGPPAPIEILDGNWVRLNGTPHDNNPYMELGCVVEAEMPTLTMLAGSDTAADSVAWLVAIGDWRYGNVWEWNEAPGYKGGAVREPGRPLDFKIFDQMVISDASSFTIEMDTVYTFPLSADVRATLAEKFPPHCYRE